MFKKRILSIDDFNTLNSRINDRVTTASFNSALSQKSDVSTMTSLANRVTTLENNSSPLATRITALETWRGAKASYLGANVTGDLTTNYNVVTTLLGALVGAMNVTNDKVNKLATKVIAIQGALQTREITASA